MSGVLSFLIGCVMLAICLSIGMFVLSFVLNLIFITGALIYTGLNWIWQKLTQF